MKDYKILSHWTKEGLVEKVKMAIAKEWQLQKNGNCKEV